MLSREEMIKLLAEEYNIHNEKELMKALEEASKKFVFFEIPIAEVKNADRNIQGVS